MQILKFIFILIEVLILFNLIIIAHELGHFLAAKWRGLKIEKFGIWFGKPIFEKEINGIKYSLGSIPAGGFVALPQMAPMEALEGKNESDKAALPNISPLDKIIVAFAGPLFSFMTALLCASLIWVVGRPVSESELTRTIGYVMPDSPAANSGIQAGDEVVSIDGVSVDKFLGLGKSIAWLIASSEGETIEMRVKRGEEILTFEPKPEIPEKQNGWERAGTRQIKILPSQTPLVAKVYPNSPAEKAGIQANDWILKADGERLYHPMTLSDIISSKGVEPIELEIQRGKEVLSLQVTPEMPEYQAIDPTSGEAVAMDSNGEALADLPEPTPKIGVQWDLVGEMKLDRPTPWTQVKASVSTMIGTLSALVSPKSDIKVQHLSGPVGIMRIYYLLFESDQGWRLAIWFSVLFNVNLAILNLVPLPVLDGGHILIAIIEGVFRRPISLRVLEVIQTGCALLLISFMLYVTFYDVGDLKGPDEPSGPQIELQFQGEKPVSAEPAPAAGADSSEP